jgi:hypothetical protein
MAKPRFMDASGWERTAGYPDGPARSLRDYHSGRFRYVCRGTES